MATCSRSTPLSLTPTKSYGDLVALAPLDLAIRAGERVALVGHNGSGKSMFLGMTAGLLEPSDGSSEVAGAPAGASAARASVSFIPDDPVLYDDLSVREHLAYVAALQGVDAVSTRSTTCSTASACCTVPTTSPLARFSRGLRQKTSIALGLVRPLDVLLVDEPFVGLDAPGKRALLALLDQIHHDGSTVVVATHDPLYVERVDRCVALRDGQLIHDGPATPDDVLRLVCA